MITRTGNITAAALLVVLAAACGPDPDSDNAAKRADTVTSNRRATPSRFYR